MPLRILKCLGLVPQSVIRRQEVSLVEDKPDTASSQFDDSDLTSRETEKHRSVCLGRDTKGTDY